MPTSLSLQLTAHAGAPFGSANAVGASVGEGMWLARFSLSQKSGIAGHSLRALVAIWGYRMDEAPRSQSVTGRRTLNLSYYDISFILNG